MSTMTEPAKPARTKPSKLGRRRQLAVLVAVSLTAAACGSSTASTSDSNGESASTDSGVGSELDTSEGTDSESPSESSTTTTSTTEAESSTTTASTEPEEVGSALDFFPPIGTVFSVVGVRWDDDLNFRSAPGTSNPVLDNVTSVDDEHTITGLGQAWQFDDSIWWKVNVDGTEAWASQRFLAAPGFTDDIFDEVAAELGVLKAADMEDLADKVAGTRDTGGPEPRVVVVAEPVAIDATQVVITIDVLDFGDDALKGERLRILAGLAFNADDPSVVDFVVLEGVQRTILCGRGVTEGLCL